MFDKLVPKDHSFFDDLDKIAAHGEDVAAILADLLADRKNLADKVGRIKTLEHEADECGRRIFERSHRTFITPLDRDDLFQLAESLDDVIDLMNGAAERVRLYEVGPALDEAKDLTRCLLDSTRAVRLAVRSLHGLSDSGGILKICLEIGRLENEGDRLLRQSLSRLFREENDIKSLLKWKEIIEKIEDAVDRCEDVADVIRGIVLEHA